ncbi:hypothetical protein ACWGI9_41945 [Streptomyces sp. NPDC054833]
MGDRRGPQRRDTPLLALALVLMERLDGSDTDEDRRAASAALEQAARAPTAQLQLRVLAAQLLGRLEAGRQDWRRATIGFGLAVELLPYLAARTMSRPDQEHWRASSRSSPLMPPRARLLPEIPNAQLSCSNSAAV